MKRETFYLHSILPPAEWKDRLDLEVRALNHLHKKECKVVLKWKDENRFTAYMVDYGGGSGAYCNAGVGPGRAFLSFGAVESKKCFFSPVYCGQIAPDGTGTVASGYFRQPMWGWLVWIVFLIFAVEFGIGVYDCIMEWRNWMNWIICLIALAIAFNPFKSLFQGFLWPEQMEPAKRFWATLEYLVATIDGLAMEEAEEKQARQ